MYMEPIPKNISTNLVAPPKAPPPSPPSSAPAVLDSVIAAQQNVTHELQQHLSNPSSPLLSFTPSTPAGSTSPTSSFITPAQAQRPLPHPLSPATPSRPASTTSAPSAPSGPSGPSAPTGPSLSPPPEITKKVSPKVPARNQSAPFKSADLPDHSKLDHSKSDHSKVELSKSDHSKSDSKLADIPKAEGTKVERPKSGTKLDMPKPGTKSDPQPAKPDTAKATAVEGQGDLQIVNKPDKQPERDPSKAAKRLSQGKNLPMPPRKLELTYFLILFFIFHLIYCKYIYIFLNK